MPTTENNQFIYSAKESKPEFCPVCGVGQLEYGTLKILDSCVEYPWTCKSCNATGNEYANLSFDGHRVDTCSLPVGTRLAMEIKINVPYVTVWDGGTEIRTNAVLNLSTGEITDITIVPHTDVNLLEREYIILNDAEISVIADDAPGYWVKLCDGHVGPCTDNYLAHRKAMSELSICDIVRAVDYINELSHFLNDKNEILNDMDTVLEPFKKVMKALRTSEECRHGCCNDLYKSDLPQYDYVCHQCDENF